MRASTKKRLLVEPDLLNGDLVEMNRIVTKYDDVEYATNKSNKAVGAMAEDRCTEISGTEEEKPAWQQSGSRRAFSHPFSKPWYAECAEDKSGVRIWFHDANIPLTRSSRVTRSINGPVPVLHSE